MRGDQPGTAANRDWKPGTWVTGCYAPTQNHTLASIGDMQVKVPTSYLCHTVTNNLCGIEAGHCGDSGLIGLAGMQFFGDIIRRSITSALPGPWSFATC